MPVKTTVYLVRSLWDYQTECLPYFCLSSEAGQWFARPVRNLDNLQDRGNNAKHFSIVIEPKSGYSCFFSVEPCLKDSVLEFLFKVFFFFFF